MFRVTSIAQPSTLALRYVDEIIATKIFPWSFIHWTLFKNFRRSDLRHDNDYPGHIEQSDHPDQTNHPSYHHKTLVALVDLVALTALVNLEISRDSIGPTCQVYLVWFLKILKIERRNKIVLKISLKEKRKRIFSQNLENSRRERESCFRIS